jgi:hypothetical protein
VAAITKILLKTVARLTNLCPIYIFVPIDWWDEDLWAAWSLSEEWMQLATASRWHIPHSGRLCFHLLLSTAEVIVFLSQISSMKWACSKM